MMDNDELKRYTKFFDVEGQEFKDWPVSVRQVVTDKYFGKLAVVERAEIMHEALHIIEDENPFVQQQQFMEALQMTIRSLLFNTVQERVRCLH